MSHLGSNYIKFAFALLLFIYVKPSDGYRQWCKYDCYCWML